MSTRNRAGFTLVELLVVIAIIGILVALISAAAMQAINAAQRAACQNNQHNIWTAIEVYESRKQRYPGWRTTLAGRQVSWTVQLMPFLSMNDQYNVWATTGSTLTTPGITLYVCPSDDQDTPGGPWLSYGTNNGILDTVVAGKIVESKANGLFFDNVVTASNPVPIFNTASDVFKKDGTAQTLGLGENRRLYNWSGYGTSGTVPLEYLTGFVWRNLTGSYSWATASGFDFTSYRASPSNSWLAYPINQTDTTTGVALLATATDGDAARISGPHGNVAVVTFADGHGMYLNAAVDYFVYNKLCTPDGVSLSQPPLDYAEYNK
jgi:prepilin-type N-terminal cleavage/methylation domain-containing protein/prepilin-type processing-associated H-X9-DG protein